MAETRLFQGLITDIGIQKALDTQTVEGWYITPYKYALSETKGEFATSRTDMRTTWYDHKFSNVEKLGTDRIKLSIVLKGDEDTIQRQIQEIYVICKTPTGEDFLFALVQPLQITTFTPNVTQEMSFLLRLTNTSGQDVYNIDYIDEHSILGYQIKTEKGQPNGYCPLGAGGIVTDNYLPLRDNLPIGTIVPILCSKDYIPVGYAPCNGQEYNAAQFPAVYQDYLIGNQNPLLATCNYTEYQNSMDTYGSCAKFGVDTTNNKFKVPYIKNGTALQQALTDSEIAKLYNAGLPNITGKLLNTDTEPLTYSDIIESTGALFADDSTADTVSGQPAAARGNGASYYSFNLDASLSNQIYGNSNTVQPKAVSIRWFVLMSHGLTPESHFTDEEWQAWISQLNKNTDDIAKVDARISSILDAIYPVGHVYLTTASTCPMETLIPGSEWSLVSSGRALWTGNGSNGNTTIAAGLPNIKGAFNATELHDGEPWTSGAFTTSSGVTRKTPNATSDQSQNGFGFDASRSNSIYGKSTTVQPPAYVVNAFRRTA